MNRGAEMNKASQRIIETTKKCARLQQYTTWAIWTDNKSLRNHRRYNKH